MPSATRGEQLVLESGIYHQDKMVDCMDVIEWLSVNRESVERSGCCQGGCNRKLVPHHVHGYAVCPKTYEPCNSRKLSRLIQHLGTINGKRDSNTKRND